MSQDQQGGGSWSSKGKLHSAPQEVVVLGMGVEQTTFGHVSVGVQNKSPQDACLWYALFEARVTAATGSRETSVPPIINQKNLN